MRAAVVSTLPATQLELADVPIPVPGPADVLVRVEACGICGTDLHILDGHSYAPTLPFVLGHEPVGVVVEAGEEARDWLGLRVTITLFTGCGTCRQCLAGDERLCPRLVAITGVLGEWGAYATHVRVHARQLVEVPAALDPVSAAGLVDAGATAANSVRHALTRRPDRAVVLGAGPIGHLSAELLRHADVPVQVVEPHPVRGDAIADLGYEVAAELGPEHCGTDVIVDCSGAPSAVVPALDALGPRGLFLLAGYSRVPDVDFAVVARKEATIQGIRSGSRADLESILDLAAAGLLRLPDVITWGLEDVNDAIAALRAGQVPGKAVIVPVQEGTS
jgi:alcohol dehydrogenase, propanol-preferring